MAKLIIPFSSKMASGVPAFFGWFVRVFNSRITTGPDKRSCMGG
jgi:hypothetical protein